MADNVTTPLTDGTVFKTKETASNGHMPGHVLYDSAEAEVLGTVTASPTANTVLGRLKDLLSLIVLAAGTNIIGKVGIDQTTDGTTNLVAAKQNGTWNVAHGKTIKTVSGSLTADTDVIAAVTSKRIKVIAYSLITTGVNATTAIFKSNGTAGTELWRVALQAPAASSMFGANLAVPAPSFLFATVVGEKLTLDVSSADTIHYSIAYFDDDAS